ncbi:hypothetical protein EYF80_050707 [Liparis tanakae]|uniref:Uncharacterized protein n=1 Tax=Liparis tanakae TaxID=230148 RepID=A0A4Z2FED4_9TELE|nr:hypothetical protein EYF80_050707 [Liparis tanakae]
MQLVDRSPWTTRPHGGPPHPMVDYQTTTMKPRTYRLEPSALERDVQRTRVNIQRNHRDNGV